MRSVVFKRVFSAAHRLYNDTSKCHNLHGHNYKVEILVETPELSPPGFAIPFDRIKEIVDAYDHTLILWAHDPLIEIMSGRVALILCADEPTTENLAQGIAELVAQRLPLRSTVHVKLQETKGIEAIGTVYVD